MSMTPDARFALALAVVCFYACAAPTRAWAMSDETYRDCKRVVPYDGPPGLDGPGAFGPLQDTLTLDCLVFVGTASINGKTFALLKDEKGTVHRVQPGDYVGENTGRVAAIAGNRVDIEQLVQDADGGWVEVRRYLFRDGLIPCPRDAGPRSGDYAAVNCRREPG